MTRKRRLFVVPKEQPEHIRLLVGIRQYHKWSRRDLADRLGISAFTVRDWETGAYDPHPSWMPRLRSLLAPQDADADQVAQAVAAYTSVSELLSRRVLEGTLSQDRADEIRAVLWRSTAALMSLAKDLSALAA